MNRISWLPLLIVGAWTTLSPAQPSSRAPDEVRALVHAAVADGKAPSVAVAVAREGRLLWSEAAGFADTAGRRAATPSTPYSIASVTKTFTATALMILAERGKVALDEPLASYLGPLGRPGVRAEQEVTLRRTLGHVAGFPQHYQYFYSDRSFRPLPFARRTQCLGAEVGTPGTRYVYSNLGYGVLDELVARVSGEPYPAFLSREIFQPLGLTTAAVPRSADEAAQGATRYGTDGQPLPFYTTDHEGASAIYASVEDLARFGLFHAGALQAERHVLSADSLALMQQPGLGGYGLGWAINQDWNRRRVLWHSGAMPGAAATLWVVPGERLAVAVVSNHIRGPVNQLAGDILARLLGVEVPSGRRSGAPDEAPGPPHEISSPPPDVRGRWRGAIRACPEAIPLALDVRGDYDIGVVVGSERERAAQSPQAGRGRVSGDFPGAGEMGASRFHFALEARGDRLEGPVVRTTSLGARGNVRVTLWATLAREPQSTVQAP